MNRNRRYFGLDVLRNVDRELMPVVITCPAAICLLLIGGPLFVFTLIWKSVVSLDEANGSRTTATLLLIISSIMISISLILTLFAIVFYKRYDKRRRNIMRNADGGYVISPPAPPNRDPQTANLISESHPYSPYPQSPASVNQSVETTTDTTVLSPASDKEC